MKEMNELFGYIWKVNLFLFTICLRHLNCETYNDDSVASLGFAFEYKIHVDAGRAQCYYQNVKFGYSLYVAFEVMRGGDGKASFSIRDPVGNVLLPHKWQEKDEYNVDQIQIPGFFEFCIDNSYSRFAAKLVSFYATSYKRDEWEKFVDEALKAESTVTNITTILQNVDKNIGTMMQFIGQSKQHKSHDSYLIDANNRYVQNWSILQCFIIFVASVIQLFCLKSFFNVDDKRGLGGMPKA